MEPKGLKTENNVMICYIHYSLTFWWVQILGDPQSCRRLALFDAPMASLRVVAVSGETLQTFPLERLEASASKGFGVDAQIAFIALLFFAIVFFAA